MKRSSKKAGDLDLELNDTNRDESTINYVVDAAGKEIRVKPNSTFLLKTILFDDLEVTG
jgi:hypothetical protein